MGARRYDFDNSRWTSVTTTVADYNAAPTNNKFVVAVDDVEDSLAMLRLLRAHYPDAQVLAALPDRSAQLHYAQTLLHCSNTRPAQPGSAGAGTKNGADPAIRAVVELNPGMFTGAAVSPCRRRSPWTRRRC